MQLCRQDLKQTYPYYLSSPGLQARDWGNTASLGGQLRVCVMQDFVENFGICSCKQLTETLSAVCCVYFLKIHD